MKKGATIGVIALFLGLMVVPSFSAEVSKITPIQKKTVGLINTVEGYGVELSCDDSYHYVKAGETTIFMVTITNTGTLDDTYDISVAPLENAGITIYLNGQYGGLRDFPLESHTSKTLEASVLITSAISSNGEWFVAVAARSQNDKAVSDELRLTANVIGPILRVNFQSGLEIRLLIRNVGDEVATNVYPTDISISGALVLFGGKGDPPIEELINDPTFSVLWKQNILALGLGYIEVTVSCDQGATVTAATNALFLGSFVIIQEFTP